VKYDNGLERVIVMTNVGFWFLFGSAFVSAAVIGWVCFLELTYQLERRRSRQHAATISLAGLQTAGAAREILLQPRQPADGFQEQSRSAGVEAEVKIAHAFAQAAALRARQANGGEPETPVQFCR
jgi:hypothetical protein